MLDDESSHHYNENELKAGIIREGLSCLTTALSNLGTGNAATPMGAIEVLSISVKEGSESIASAMSEIAQSIDRLACAVENMSDN